MIHVFINADDFGLNPSVNSAIIESFNNNIINSTTLMSNMPSFEEAVELAHKAEITDRIGIHLNLDDGNLLTSNDLITNLFSSGNRNNSKDKRRRLFNLSNEAKKLIYKEFAAQIMRARESGINITHIDTHHHIHEIWSITKIVLDLLKEYNISSMRILNNLNRSTSFYKSGYRNFINNVIIRKNANFSDFFGNQFEAAEFLKMNPSAINRKKIEIMVHPDHNNTGLLIDKIKDREYSFDYPEALKKLISRQNGS